MNMSFVWESRMMSLVKETFSWKLQFHNCNRFHIELSRDMWAFHAIYLNKVHEGNLLSEIKPLCPQINSLDVFRNSVLPVNYLAIILNMEDLDMVHGYQIVSTTPWVSLNRAVVALTRSRVRERPPSAVTGNSASSRKIVRATFITVT